jgi:hypothetical protein
MRRRLLVAVAGSILALAPGAAFANGLWGCDVSTNDPCMTYNYGFQCGWCIDWNGGHGDRGCGSGGGMPWAGMCTYMNFGE